MRIQIHRLSCLHFHPHGHKLPCLHCNPHAFIRMVHHLIERCIVFRMGRDECVMTLAKRANINPVVTSTVWEELFKENRVFFEAYSRRRIIPSKITRQPQETSNGRTWRW
ncbi:hypothetical protein L1987_65801 [Smallanthus sonchifolius]|uniref:Uncharacterized protein n=1 Tax=Smallanthus sonchifolius TaxID=185202 RepID=A0ACB9BVD0_9ASTR|nr:hypothetical protein L1987_65801 [Smallanthus sonchifolius]